MGSQSPIKDSQAEDRVLGAHGLALPFSRSYETVAVPRRFSAKARARLPRTSLDAGEARSQ